MYKRSVMRVQSCLFCQSKQRVLLLSFLPFSLPLPSSLLKLPIVKLGNSPEENLSKKKLKTSTKFLFTNLFFEEFNFLHEENVLLLKCR